MEPTKQSDQPPQPVAPPEFAGTVIQPQPAAPLQTIEQDVVQQAVQPAVNVIESNAVPPQNPVPLFMQPSVAPVLAPKKSKSLLWVWIVVGIFLLMALAAGAAVYIGWQNTQESAKNISQNAASTPDENNKQSAAFALTRNIVTAADPAWVFPASVLGWEMKVIDENGINQLSKQNSESLFTSYQLLKPADIPAEDDAATTSYLDFNITTFRKSVTVSNLIDSNMDFTTTSGDTVTFKVRNFDYTVPSGKLYKQRLVARITDKHVLAISYGALASEFTEAEWSELTKNVQIVGQFE